MGYWYDIKVKFFLDDKLDDAIRKLADINLPEDWQYAEGDVNVSLSYNAYYHPDHEDEVESATKLTVYLRDEGRTGSSSCEELIWFNDTARRLGAKKAVFRFSPDCGNDEVYEWGKLVDGEDWNDLIDRIKDIVQSWHDQDGA